MVFMTPQPKTGSCYINNGSRETLERVIRQYVRARSVIWTDVWRGYANLENIGYVHHTVKHSNSNTGVCTNQVEGFWSNLKQYLRRLSVTNQVEGFWSQLKKNLRRLSVISLPFFSEYLDLKRISNLAAHIAEKYTYN